MKRITFLEVFFIGAMMSMLSDNSAFMTEMRHGGIAWWLRYPIGFTAFGVVAGLYALLWRAIFGKDRWS